MTSTRKSTHKAPASDRQQADALAKWAAGRGVGIAPRALETLSEFRARLIAALAKEDAADG